MSIFDSDWFKRSNEYTVANTNIKLGWDSNLTGKYSSYLYSNTKANILLNSKIDLENELNNLSRAIGLDNVSVHVDTHNETSMTDGKNIIVSRKFDTKVGDLYDTLDLIIGLLCHECSHCLYTDFNYIERENKRTKINQTIHMIHNIIEDEIIETKLGMKYPGYINFISQVKYYYFDKCFTNNDDNVNQLDEILNLLLVVIRYPKYINDVLNRIEDKNPSRIAEYETLFTEINKILSTNYCLDPVYNPSITLNSFHASIEIYALLKKYIDDKNQQSNTGDSNDADSESDSDGSFSSQESEISAEPKSTLNKVVGIEQKCSAKSETNKPKTYSKYFDEKVDSIDLENNKSASIGLTPSETIGDKNHNQITAECINIYNTKMFKLKKYINTAKKLFINNSHKDILITNRFRRNGTLDTRKLADAMMNINTVYEQKQNKKIDINSKFALVLCLDESLSMSFSDLFDTTSDIAIIITEALNGYNDIEFFVYGHGDNVVNYINKKENNKYILTNRIIQCSQNEQISYKKIIEDVKKQTNLPIVMLNITDSAYLANPENVKLVINKYKKRKVSFNCIMVMDKENKLDRNVEEFNDEIYGYDNWVKIDKLFNDKIFKDVINKLANIIKKNIIKYK